MKFSNVLLGILCVFYCPSRIIAAEWREDASLVDSDASFYSINSTAYVGHGGMVTMDLNGDGYLDLVISSPGDDTHGLDTGGAYIVMGPGTSWSSDEDLSGYYFYNGTVESSFVSESLASAGDTNGDGLPDLLVAAPRYYVGDAHTGQVYLVLGSASGWINQAVEAAATTAFKRDGVVGSVGDAVSGAGDVNGDGYDDFLIGGPENNGGGHHNGSTYLLFGCASLWSEESDLSNADASFNGEIAQSLSGGALSSAGDTNGDGYDDFLIGNSVDENYGTHKVHLILGRSAGWSFDISLASADASFVGEAEPDCAGHSVAGVGDLDGDGLDDFLIGAPRNGEAGQYAGQVYLLYGKTTKWSANHNLALADASFVGQDPGDTLGQNLDSAGDLNGDGFVDILLGVPSNSEYEMGAGQTYVLFGGPAGWSMDTPVESAAASLVGEHADDSSGWYALGGGDIDGDYLDDLLISAPTNDGGALDGGQIYLLFGNNCFDQDADGYGDPGDAACPAGPDTDCDDANPAVHPGATESCNGLDDDCDGSVPTDEADDDGDAYRLCEGDCDDNEPAVHPDAGELCDGLDNDCDEEIPTWDEDQDGDGTSACAGDCHDGDPAMHIDDEDGDGVSPCDGDCDDDDATMHSDDVDQDGFSPCAGDCDDASAEVNPDAEEICNGIDDDCDGELQAEEADEDADGVMICEGDCDDGESEAYPGALEICDGLDNDCNGETDEIDADGDGVAPFECGGEDCDDGDPAVNPMASEDCEDLIDNDCDGTVDDEDEDCASISDDDDTGDVVGDDDTTDDSATEGCECGLPGDSAPFRNGASGWLLFGAALWLLHRR